jgi:hypothetical protein
MSDKGRNPPTITAYGIKPLLKEIYLENILVIWVFLENWTVFLLWISHLIELGC